MSDSVPRHHARQAAVQILYQMDKNHELSPEFALTYFKAHFATEGVPDGFVRELVEGVSARLTELDSKIESAAENWRMERMPVVDRAILRLGTYELFFCDAIPVTVSLDEMVELSKQFGSEHSPAFVNGVLDKLAKSIENPKKAP